MAPIESVATEAVVFFDTELTGLDRAESAILDVLDARPWAGGQGSSGLPDLIPLTGDDIAELARSISAQVQQDLGVPMGPQAVEQAFAELAGGLDAGGLLPDWTIDWSIRGRTAWRLPVPTAQ